MPDLYCPYDPTSPNAWIEMNLIRSTYASFGARPRNLRLRPSGHFDEGGFRDSLSSSVPELFEDAPDINVEKFENAGGIESWVKFARIWYEEGI